MRQMTIFAQHLWSILGGAFFVGAFAFIVLATSPGANAFTFTTIDVPGATHTSANRINALGQIVGGYIEGWGQPAMVFCWTTARSL